MKEGHLRYRRLKDASDAIFNVTRVCLLSPKYGRLRSCEVGPSCVIDAMLHRILVLTLYVFCEGSSTAIGEKIAYLPRRSSNKWIRMMRKDVWVCSWL